MRTRRIAAMFFISIFMFILSGYSLFWVFEFSHRWHTPFDVVLIFISLFVSFMGAGMSSSWLLDRLQNGEK